jgi:hypothetical protein
VLSLLMFTGASQFALVGVLGAGGSAAAASRRCCSGRATRYGGADGLAAAERGRGALGLGAGDHRRVGGNGVRRARARRSGFWAPGSASSFGTFTLLARGAAQLGDPGRSGWTRRCRRPSCALLWPQLPPRLVAVAAAGALARGVACRRARGVPVLLAGLVVARCGRR